MPTEYNGLMARPIDYDDLMAAALVDDQPAVAKILDRLSNRQLKVLRAQTITIGSIAYATLMARQQNLNIADRWYPR